MYTKITFPSSPASSLFGINCWYYLPFFLVLFTNSAFLHPLPVSLFKMLRCVAGFIQFGRLPPAQVGPVALEPAFSRPHPGVSAEETPVSAPFSLVLALHLVYVDQLLPWPPGKVSMRGEVA